MKIIKINTIPGRILGIFWTTASWSPNDGGTMQITNKDRSVVEEVNIFFAKYDFHYTIYLGPTEKKRPDYDYNYYRMKIYNHYIINLLRNYYNWRGRREEKRYYPIIDCLEQEIDFLKYYIDDQGSFDYIRSNKRKRYRVWGHKTYINMDCQPFLRQFFLEH